MHKVATGAECRVHTILKTDPLQGDDCHVILAMDTIQFPCRPLFEGGAPATLELDDADGRTNAELNPPWGFARRYTMALVPSVTSM